VPPGRFQWSKYPLLPDPGTLLITPLFDGFASRATRGNLPAHWNLPRRPECLGLPSGTGSFNSIGVLFV
jgi:hypothetical protein